MNQKVRDIVLDIIVMVVGAVLMSISMAMFTVPNNMVPGGITGLSIALASILPFKVGHLILFFSLLVALLGWWQLGYKLILKSTIISVLISLMVDPLGEILPHYTENLFTATLVGAAIMGVAVALTFTRNMSSGGTDTLGLVMKKHFPQFPVGQMLLAIDFCVVVMGTIIFHNLDVAIYSTIFIFISSRVVDAFLQGIDFSKLIYIITDKREVVIHGMSEANIGVTVLNGQGGYTGNEKCVIMAAIKKKRIAIALKTIKQLDNEAFIIVQDATEIHGKGFKYDVKA